SGNLLTRCHTTGLPVRKLARIGARTGASLRICEWQVMHTSVAGKPALAEVITPWWQYWQERPSSPTWWACENGTGCAGIANCPVFHGEWSKVVQPMGTIRIRAKRPQRTRPMI